MRKPLVLVLLALALAGSTLPAEAASTKKVKVGDLFFRKAKVTVQSGDTVKWTWVGELPHDVTVKKGPRKFHSKTKTSGTFKRTLRKTGTYRYICTVHPDDMKGKVVVE